MADKINEEDELPSMGDLFLSIWNIRRFVMLSSILGVFFVIGFIAMKRVTVPTQQTFQSAISFVFNKNSNLKNQKQVISGRYPNGRIFSINDIIAPIILNKVYDQNHLEKFFINRKDFLKSISIYHYSVNLNSIVKRYQSRLKNKRLSFVERKTIEGSMEKELDEASSKGALIRFSISNRFTLPPLLGEKIVNNIAAVWSKTSIQQFGVLQFANTAIGTEFVNEALISRIDVPSALYFLENSVEELEKQLSSNQLLLSGSATVREKESGYTRIDLLHKINLFKNYDLKSLSGDIFLSHQIPDQKKVLFLFQRRLDDAKQQKQFLLHQVEVYSKALKMYKSKGNSISKEISQQKTGQSSTPSEFNSDFLDRIIRLTSDKEDRVFRQNIIGKQINLEKAASEKDKQIQKIKSFIAVIEKGSETPASSTSTEELYKKLNDHAKILNGYWKITDRLYSDLSAKNFSYDGHLYVTMPLSQNKKTSYYHPIFNKYTGVFALASIIMIMVISLFLGLIWQFIAISGKN